MSRSWLFLNRSWLFLISLLLWHGGACAGDYLNNTDFLTFIDAMQKKHAFNQPDLVNLFADAKREDSIIAAMQRPAEKTKTWGEYRKLFITEKQIENGVKFWNENKKAVLEASRHFQVAPEIIVAILGVETRYGSNKGGYRVIDALSTLAFDYPPRAGFFRKELEEFLLLSRDAKLDLPTVKGSYAGAMGYSQFIPSSYRHYAVDFDKDGKVDLIDSVPDAVGSVANYFNRHGWQPGAAVAMPAKASHSDKLRSYANQSLKPSNTLAELSKEGLSVPASMSKDTRVNLMILEGDHGDEYWLGLHNFYVITRYNHSHLYAMAVYQLSEALRDHQ